MHLVDVLRTTLLEDEVGEGPVAQDVGQPATQIDDARHQGQVAVGIVVGAEGHVGHIHLPAQLALVGIGHEGAVAGSLEGEEPALFALFLGSQSSGLNLAFGETAQVGLVGQVELEGVGLLQHVLLKLEGCLTQLHLQARKLLLLFGREHGSVAHEGLIHIVEQRLFLGLQGAMVGVDGPNALPQGFVEHNLVAVLGQYGRHLLGQGVHLVVGVGTEQIEKHVADARQRAVASGNDGVLESGLLGIADDALDVGIVALHALEHCFFVILKLYLVEGHRVVQRSVGLI